MNRFVHRIVLFLGLVFTLQAQVDNGVINGSITDPSGSAVAQATVSVHNVDKGFERGVTTSDSGVYSFSALPGGRYVLTVSAAGFSRTTVEAVVLQAGQNLTLDQRLEIASTSAEVNVTASVTEVERSSAELGSDIDATQIRNLPVNGRHYFNLVALAPGAINTGGGDQKSIRILGHSKDDVNFTLDGIDDTGVKQPRQEADFRLIVSTDSIQEFRVNSALYGADQGGADGAQIALVTKSGTNDFHGGVFEYFRNDALDAQRATDAAKQPIRLNQFGGSFGGPIRKNKTFFFGNFEALEERVAVTFNNGLVPSASYRSQTLAASPQLKPILDFYPAGTSSLNSTTDYLTGVGRQSLREYSGTARVDHYFNNRLSGFFRYNVDDGVFHDPQDALLDIHEENARPANAVAALTATITPTLISETRLGYNRSPFREYFTGLPDTALSIPGYTSIPEKTVNNEIGDSFSVIENFSWNKGRHTFKFGFEGRLNREITSETDVTSVSYSTLPNFQKNLVDSLTSTSPQPSAQSRRSYLFGFAQDTFKVNPNLTISLGLRYEYYTVMHETRNRGRVFDFYQCQGFCAAGTPWYYGDPNNFDPRIGIAWSPKALGGNTVIRTGFGIYHGPGQNDDFNSPVDSIPDRLALSLTDVATLSYPIAPYLAIAKVNGQVPRAIDRHQRNFYAENWILTLEEKLPSSFVGSVTYSGSEAHRVSSRGFANLIDPVSGLRPLPAFGQIDMKLGDGNSNFNALQASMRRSFAKGWQVQMQYMWSHAINDASTGGGESKQPENVGCRVCDRGSSDFDIRHTFVLNWVYSLPALSGRDAFVRSMLGGWKLNGLASARTGLPLTILAKRSAKDLPDGNTKNQRASYDGLDPYTSNPSPDGWLNPAAFITPAKGVWGNSGRNNLRGPGLFQIDVGLEKQFRTTERTNLEFRAEAFNLANHPNFAAPDLNVADVGLFGRIQSILNWAQQEAVPPVRSS